MAETKVVSRGGIGFCGLLGIVFIVLKLCKIIDWSWWFVLMPLYLPWAIILLVILIIFLVALLK